MSAKLHVLSDLPAVVVERQQRRADKVAADARRAAGAQFAGKTWTDLKPDDRDDLLKAVAIRLGIIEPDA